MYKPMKCFTIDLEGKHTPDKMHYPVYVSNKLDGIRGTVHIGRFGSTSQKPLPSKLVQLMASKLPTGLDGELVYGDPSDERCMSLTQTAVMSIEWPKELDPNELRFYVFDWVLPGVAFDDRLTRIIDWIAAGAPSFVVFVEQRIANNGQQLTDLYDAALKAGYEGIITKSRRGLYKHGRSTFNEGGAGKLKPFGKELFEARVLDWSPLEIQRSTFEASNFPLTILEELDNGNVIVDAVGTLHVEDVKTKIQFDIGGGHLFTMLNRIDMFSQRASLAGRIIQYKCMTYGTVEKPRQPVGVRWRSELDMTEY